MLRAVRDREVAREAARVNVSALLFGQARIVPLERTMNSRELHNALARGGEDLTAIRRAVSALLLPEMSRMPLRHIGHVGPER
jgi:hypothetical protein